MCAGYRQVEQLEAGDPEGRSAVAAMQSVIQNYSGHIRLRCTGAGQPFEVHGLDLEPAERRAATQGDVRGLRRRRAERLGGGAGWADDEPDEIEDDEVAIDRGTRQRA